MVQLTEKAKKLIGAPNIGNLATLMADGTPHLTPVWVDYEDNHVLVNTAEGRQKLVNVRRDPRVAVSVFNADNPYEMVSIRGRVVETTHEGADEHIDKLAKKYLGRERYPFRRQGEQRVIIKIEPEHVMGSS
ncbi:MAG: PPOX class F420-dependent oxidoreductase [Dehalococcoidia bacterium]|nr:PPOX class F420-dependent oxidoreductase [Dehalococcoidia bacterium]